MENSNSSIICYIVLAVLVTSCKTAPFLSTSSIERDIRSINKFTCKHKSEALNRDWKHCTNKGEDVLDLIDIHIPQAVSTNRISALNIPIK